MRHYYLNVKTNAENGINFPDIVLINLLLHYYGRNSISQLAIVIHLNIFHSCVKFNAFDPFALRSTREKMEFPRLMKYILTFLKTHYF